MSTLASRFLWILALALATSACRGGREPDAQPGAAPVSAGRDLAATLVAHRWSLRSANDVKGAKIEGVNPTAERAYVFHFFDSRVSIEGGCNRLNGAFRVDAEGQLSVSRLASTMMACEPALMAADATLSALLAKPLQVELTPGDSPSLRLLTSAKDTLVLAGQRTPESLYGAPTRVFLEIAAQPVPCPDPPAPSTACLQVREIRFDEQGLRVGEPGAWTTFAERIDGYTHTAGQRTLLRLKRFDRKSAEGEPPYLYVLDLVVESGGEPR